MLVGHRHSYHSMRISDSKQASHLYLAYVFRLIFSPPPSHGSFRLGSFQCQPNSTFCKAHLWPPIPWRVWANPYHDFKLNLSIFGRLVLGQLLPVPTSQEAGWFRWVIPLPVFRADRASACCGTACWTPARVWSFPSVKLPSFLSCLNPAVQCQIWERGLGMKGTAFVCWELTYLRVCIASAS